MTKQKNQNSFILIFTIAIISLITILTHQLVKTVYVGTSFDNTMIEREQAEMLAIGGINLAISQLTISNKISNKSKEETEKEKKKRFTKYISRLLPNINRWQVFDLIEDIDGINGKIKICITCENGKININKAFDFEKQEFKKEYEKLLKNLKFGTKEFGTKEKAYKKYLKKLVEFLKKRNKKIEDISQLQKVTKEKGIELFYSPPKIPAKISDSKPNQTIALQDIFTIWHDSEKLEALFLSDGLCSMLNFRRPQTYDSKNREEKFKSVIKNFSPEMDQNSDKYWQIVRPLYEQKNKFKIEENKIFSSKFEPNTYSVLSSGKVGTVEQKLLAIIRKDKEDFKIIRMYWI